MKLKKKVKKVVEEPKKGKFDDIEFDIKIPRTHAPNEANWKYLEGEKSMLKKCKKILGE